MKIALVGATGFVGSKILEELLNRGQEVTIVVRNPEKISEQNSNLKVAKGDVFDETSLVTAFTGNDVVISAYNPGWTNPEIYNEFLAGSKAIQNATKLAGVKRFLVIGGAGSLYVAPNVQLIDTPEFPKEIKPGATAAKEYLDILKNETEIDWTFFSPAIEMHQGTSGVKKGTYRKGLENPVFDADGRSVLSVEDLALVIADEIENPQHINQRFTAAY